MVNEKKKMYGGKEMNGSNASKLFLKIKNP